MRRLSMSEAVNAFASLGIGRGDVVHVQSDLRRIGPADAPLTIDGLCGFYLEALRTVLGPEGTITACTAFEDYGRFGTPFVRESSPSRTDMLSEFLRTRPGAVRSMHPIVSVCALGPRAEEIAGGPHYDGFGGRSAWARLHQADAKLLTLGLSADLGGTTFFHYVERLYGMPYVYTKIFRYPVISHGHEIPGPFTMSVRYLDFGIVNTPVAVKHSLLDGGIARQVLTGRASSWCAPAKAVVDHMFDLFDRDRWIMLEQPPAFVPGRQPMDGPTGELRVSSAT